MVNMDHGQAKIRIEELRKTLWENSRRYYVDNAPTMSDFEYDHLMRELEDLEKEYPDLLTPDSPTQKVGSDLDQSMGTNAEPAVRKEFAQYTHKYPMLSLGNTYNIGEIEDFVRRAEKDLGEVKFTYSCELKFDGTAICLTSAPARSMVTAYTGPTSLRPAIASTRTSCCSTPMHSAIPVN